GFSSRPIERHSVLLTPPPKLDEELWAGIRQRWQKGRVVAIRRKTLRLALLRPMPEQPLTTQVIVGWAYVATEHELRRERPADELAIEWREDTLGSPPGPRVAPPPQPWPGPPPAG